MPVLALWQDAFATTGLANMATVRQSITALYEEAQRLAVEGAPMLAVLQTDAAGPNALPDRVDADGAIPLPVAAIAARFEELRRLAALEADPAAETCRQDLATESTMTRLMMRQVPPMMMAMETAACLPWTTIPATSLSLTFR